MDNLHLNGLAVYIVQPSTVKIKVKRGLIERFFSLPFKPFTKFNMKSEIHEMIEDGVVLKTEKGLHMNAKTWNELQRSNL